METTMSTHARKIPTRVTVLALVLLCLTPIASAASPPDQGSLRFGPGGQTIAGPASMKVNCTYGFGGNPTLLFDAERDEMICATVENIGNCRLDLTLESPTSTMEKQEPGASLHVASNESRTVCKEASRLALESCSGGWCTFHWRVDRVPAAMDDLAIHLPADIGSCTAETTCANGGKVSCSVPDDKTGSCQTKPASYATCTILTSDGGEETLGGSCPGEPPPAPES